ncbi:hypothetical protein ACXZ66_11130 [Corynebacterium sp. S7]
MVACFSCAIDLVNGEQDSILESSLLTGGLFVVDIDADLIGGVADRCAGCDQRVYGGAVYPLEEVERND